MIGTVHPMSTAAQRQQRAAESKPCECTWDEGDAYSPPSPLEICDYCHGGMAATQRIAHALNQQRAQLDARDDHESAGDADAIRLAMVAVGLSPYA